MSDWKWIWTRSKAQPDNRRRDRWIESLENRRQFTAGALPALHPEFAEPSTAVAAPPSVPSRTDGSAAAAFGEFATPAKDIAPPALPDVAGHLVQADAQSGGANAIAVAFASSFSNGSLAEGETSGASNALHVTPSATAQVLLAAASGDGFAGSTYHGFEPATDGIYWAAAPAPAVPDAASTTVQSASTSPPVEAAMTAAIVQRFGDLSNTAFYAGQTFNSAQAAMGSTSSIAISSEAVARVAPTDEDGTSDSMRENGISSRGESAEVNSRASAGGESVFSMAAVRNMTHTITPARTMIAVAGGIFATVILVRKPRKHSSDLGPFVEEMAP